MSLDHCEELVGRHDATGNRTKQCGKPTAWYATNAASGRVHALCERHRIEYVTPAWRLVRIVR